MSDYQERQAMAIENANNLQHTANCFQEEMIKEIKTNNKETSFHSKVMIGLTVAIVFVGFVGLWPILWPNYDKIGRYAIWGSTSGGAVLDTKTSQLWIRAAGVSVYLGTNENPKREEIPRRAKTFGENDPPASISMEDLLNRIADKNPKE